MAAPIATSPHLVFGADNSFAFRTNNGGTMGPYKHGSNLYMSGYYVETPEALQANLGIFKSTDQGATWTRVAAANSPQVNWISDYWVSGNIVYFCYVNIVANPDVGFLNLASFDMSTDTLTIIATGGPDLNLRIHLSDYEFSFTPPVLLAEMVRLSNGTVVVEYGHLNNVSGVIEILMVTWSGGVWSAPQLVSSNSLPDSNSVIGIGLTTNDKAYLLWLSGTDGNVYSNVFSGGILGAPTFVLHPTAYVWDTVRTTGIYLPIHDTLVFNFESFNSVNTNKVQLLLVSAASTNAPSFSLVDTGFLTTMENNTGRQAFSYNPSETTFTIYFLDQSNPASINLNAATAAALTGPWSAPTVVWNSAANPPTPSPGSPLFLPIETLYSRTVADAFTQAFTFGFSAFSGDISGLAYSLIPPPAAALTLTLKGRKVYPPQVHP